MKLIRRTRIKLPEDKTNQLFSRQSPFYPRKFYLSLDFSKLDFYKTNFDPKSLLKDVFRFAAL